MAGAIPYGPNQTPWSESVCDLAKLSDGSYLVSPPSSDPLLVYPNVLEVNGAMYQVPSSGLTSQQRDDANARILARTRRYQSTHLGYQENQALDYGHLKDYLNIHLNNAGDPFTESNGQTSTRWIERNVLDYFASLWHAKWPHNWSDSETYWGYMLTMGSTEGNMQALWNARDYLQGKATYVVEPDSNVAAHNSGIQNHISLMQGPPVDTQQVEIAEHSHGLKPVAFYSEDSHYSIAKAVAMLDIATFYQIGVEKFPGQCPLVAEFLKPGEWPREVPTREAGGVDGHALCILVEFFASRKYPILVVFNCGSTFKGAYDEVEVIGARIVAILAKHGILNHRFKLNGQMVERQGYWMHVDGALGASYMPFLEMACRNGMTELGPGPIFDFRLPYQTRTVFVQATGGPHFYGFQADVLAIACTNNTTTCKFAKD